VFRVEDLVLVNLHPQSLKALKRSAKIENKLSDPLRIVRFLTKVTVRLTNPDTGVIVRKANVSQLKRYLTGDQGASFGCNFYYCITVFLFFSFCGNCAVWPFFMLQLYFLLRSSFSCWLADAGGLGRNF
jgi:hypothetical protein